METITVELLMTVPGVAALTTIIMQLVKKDLPEDKTQYFAVGVGWLLCFGATLLVVGPDKLMLGQAFINGLVAGAASIGIYDLFKAPLKLRSQAELKD